VRKLLTFLIVLASIALGVCSLVSAQFPPGGVAGSQLTPFTGGGNVTFDAVSN
jgi:hypothetical protein